MSELQNVYQLHCKTAIHPSNPLHVGHFYRDIQRVHQKKMEERQSLILFLARIHQEAIKSGMPLAFCRIQMSLTRLRNWVYDYRNVFDFFFEVQETGYRINNDKREMSTVIPRDLATPKLVEILQQDLVYQPPELPNDGVVSKVFIQFQNAEEIREKIIATRRFDLSAPVEWLLSRPISELNVWFSPAGKLQLRDTSTWPIKALETWPAWLRVLLFGRGIDIESAYTQYLLETVKSTYQGKEELFEMLFPELIQSFENKQEWRESLCLDLDLEPTETNVGIIKRICMSLANGSKVSGNILQGNAGFSAVKSTILELHPDVSDDVLYGYGVRLGRIAKEYANARRIACMTETHKYPSRDNQKVVFRTYFQWERAARYAIWHAVGEMGIMVHDGIDGIPVDRIQAARDALNDMKIRVI